MARTIRQPALRRDARWDDAAPASATDLDWDAIGDPVIGPAAGLRLVEQLEARCPWHLTDATLRIDRTPPDPAAEQRIRTAEQRILELLAAPPDDELAEDNIIRRTELTSIANNF